MKKIVRSRTGCFFTDLLFTSVLQDMPLGEFFTTFYGKKIYHNTKKLQQEKIQNLIGKNQMVFLYKCILNNITPKPFQIRAPTKACDIQKQPPDVFCKKRCY